MRAMGRSQCREQSLQPSAPTLGLLAHLDLRSAETLRPAMRRKPNPYITPTIAAARKAMFAASILRSVFAITRTLSGWLPRKRGSSATRPHKLRPKASPNTTTRALALRGNLFAQPAMVLDSLTGAEVVQLEQLPDLDFAILIMRVGAALDPLDRFRKRLTL
jgi:hypothetical protein